MSRRWSFVCVVVALAACSRGSPPASGGAQSSSAAGASAPVASGAAAANGLTGTPARATTPGASPSTATPPPRQDGTPAATGAPATAAATPGTTPHTDPIPPCKSKGDPLEAARRYYDAEQFEEALSCAAQATAFYPDLPQSHSERGAALSALGRFDEAQVAYARALALNPDYPDALLGAAHLFAVSLPSSRENDELASVYAEKGLTHARSQKDEKLALQFALVSAMAFNDLGRSQDALERADEVLKREKGNKEAQYERAVALFELCRFPEAKAAFTPLLADEDRGPHAHHHLGLILEREGRFEEAEKHFAIARKDAPDDFPEPIILSATDFKAEVDKAVSELPEDMRRDLVGVPVATEDLPQDDDLVGGEPPLSPTILGLFRGPPLGERCDPEPGEPCRSVALYRLNLGRAVTTKAELLEQIRVTLLHEVGHLRGEDDFELAARGLE